MKYYKHIAIAFFAIVILGTPWLITKYPTSTVFIDKIFGYVNSNIGAAFFHEGLTVNQLKEKYDATTNSRTKKVRIMIMPGHEPDYGGAEYRNLKERDMTVDLAQDLQNFFENNPHYEVIVARDKKSWNPVLQTYFNQNWNQIINFYNKSKAEMSRLVKNGSVTREDNGVFHNAAPENVATRLYGINKWNNENGVDLAIHIHFNDYPGHTYNGPGEYSGMAIYVPEKQYSNSTTTKAIADFVFKRLEKYNAVSNLPLENDGVVEEQDLIAIGSNNTLDVPSMLIEYGYIYEPQFTNDEVRNSALKDLALQTYLGIEDFFGNEKTTGVAYDTLLLPHSWAGKITANNAPEKDVLALQTALILDGDYPPKQKTKNDCPRSGTFGPCTVKALSTFQDKHGIKNEAGFVGEATKKALNNLYSATPK